MKKTIMFVLSFLFLTSLAFGDVFITELADPENGATVRYIELYNTGATAVDFTEGSGWRIDKYTNASATVSQTLSLTGTIPASGFYIIATGTDDGDFFTMYGVTADQFDGADNDVAGSNGDDNLELYDGTNTLIDQFGVPGEDGSGTSHEFEDGRAERKSTVVTSVSLWAFSNWNIWNDTGGGGTTNLPQQAPADFDPGAWIGPVSGVPLITVVPTSLTGFSYDVGSGPSTEQSFTVEGSDLTADISVTPLTDYEISEDNISYQLTAITLTQTGGAVATTTIYTRLIAGLSSGAYNEDITMASAGATDMTVACSGTVTGLEPTNHVTSFAATADGFSKIDLVWLENDGVVPPVGYLIKASTTTTITDPVDGIPEDDYSIIGDDSGAMNIAHGTNVFEWTWLDPETIYYFNIYPYTNSGVDINYKIDGIIPSDDATTGVQPATPNVFFSEYIEGSSNNKALEIFNASGSTIDLADFALWRISNGGDWAEGASNGVLPVGIVADGATWVICNSLADPLIQAVSDSIGSSITWYNGDDAVGLAYLGIPGEQILIDAVGEKGPDPGSGWDVAGITNATGEHTLVRKSSVTTGNTDWAASAGTDITDSEWIVYDQDTFVYLGAHTMGGNALPLITNIVRNPAGDVTSSTTVSVSADITDLDGTLTLVELHWGLTSGFGTTITMSNGGSGDTYTTLSDIPAQINSATVYYEVYAEDNVPESSTSDEQSYTVFPTSTTIPYNASFDPDFMDIYTYSLTGDQIWEIAGYGDPAPCAKMSGYSGGQLDNEDWMITPSFDLTATTGVVNFSFDEAINYEDSVLFYEKVLISTDYPGIGDPTTSTWTELSMPSRAAGSSWSFFPTGELDISEYNASSNVHIAFKYLSTTFTAATWEVDNVSIIESVTLDPPADLVITINGADIDLNWTASAGATGYNVFRSTDPYNFVPIAYGTSATNSYKDVGGASGVKYFYMVTATN